MIVHHASLHKEVYYILQSCVQKYTERMNNWITVWKTWAFSHTKITKSLTYKLTCSFTYLH